MLYLGADHAGFKYKEKIKEFLTASDLKFEDLGNLQLDPQDDFPIFAFRVAERVAKDLAEGDQSARGILICANGLGMSVAANKIKGIRAVLVTSKKVAQQSREHLDSNILCLGANTVSLSLAKKIIRIWLTTDFLPKERYVRRLKQITDKENATDPND